MRIVALVPIKLESQRLPFKNIRSLGGHPLCWYILNSLKKVPERVVLVFYCSNPQICDYLPSGIRYLERPVSLDRPETLGMEIYPSFAQQVDADYYLLCHTTSPYLKVSSIETGIRAIQAGYDSAFTVIRKQTFIWYEGRPLNYSLDVIPRTQDIHPIYIETSAYYLFSKKVLQEHRRIGDRPFMVVTTDLEAIDIDEESDFLLAERFQKDLDA